MKIAANNIESLLKEGVKFYNVNEGPENIRTIIYINRVMIYWQYEDGNGLRITKDKLVEGIKDKLFILL